MAAMSRPANPTVTWDANCLYRDGTPWVPVMGEVHYARMDPRDGSRELRKIKAGGITVVSTYVFWIHHEEIEGKFDWAGRRDLRRFVVACADVGLPVVVRLGPWCHGEVRNGGLPDWVVSKCGKHARTNDPAYLNYAARHYREIAKQLEGLLWKQGGPVLGVQIENEYGGPGEHLMALKKLALEAGIDVPLYTRTGWPKLHTPVPAGEMLPLYGAYAEGFWDRALTPMPGNYRKGYHFSPHRLTDDIGTDQLGQGKQENQGEAAIYPYLTCELGGGMETSYHRRVLIDPRDTLALLVTRLGSGSNLPGYYMYHGGTNPESATGISLQESQASGYWNDLPEKSYDFQAPLGQWGQVREPFHLLRRVHLFLADFGPLLAQAKAEFREEAPVRWGVRRGAEASFLFVNNHERLADLPAVPAAGFEGTPFPPFGVPEHASFFFPFHWRIGDHVLTWATAQPLCRIGKTYFFAEIDGIAARFQFANQAEIVAVRAPQQRVAAFEDAEVVLLSNAVSLGAFRACGKLATIPRSVVYEEGGQAIVETEATGARPMLVFPGGYSVVPAAAADLPRVEATPVRTAGTPRRIAVGTHLVAEAPSAADFGAAAAWRIVIPPGLPERTLLRVTYVGDVARCYAGGKFLADNFYNGRPFDLSLDELPEGAREVELRVLPLQKGAPIYLSRPPAFQGGEASIAKVIGVGLVPRSTTRLAL